MSSNYKQGETAMRGDIVRRLRGDYPIGPVLPNGEPEFGWRSFPNLLTAIGEIPRPPIMEEAALEIEGLRKAAAATENSRSVCLAELLASMKIIATESKSMQSRAMAYTTIWSVDYICEHGHSPSESEFKQQAAEISRELRAAK